MEPQGIALVFRQSDAASAHVILFVTDAMVVRLIARSVRRHADYFSHGEPSDHSSRSAARAPGAGDEPVFDGSGHALAGFHGDGRIRRRFRRRPRADRDLAGFDGTDRDYLLAPAGRVEEPVNIAGRSYAEPQTRAILITNRGMAATKTENAQAFPMRLAA